jgi:protocatechuate 3,4-dioxygenase beta subunit
MAQIGTHISKENCTVEGTVLDAAGGMPLVGAEVSVERKENGSTSPTVVKTDTNGHYAAENIQPGLYSIVARQRGYVPQMYGQHKRNREGTTLPLESGATLHAIDFRLVHTVAIAGKVLDEHGEPVTGARVQAVTPRYMEGERRLIGGFEPTKTNDFGEYRIYGLAPDRYYVGVSGEDPDQVAVMRPKGAASDERYVPTLYPNVRDIDHAPAIDLESGGEAHGIDVIVSKTSAFQIRGKIAGYGKIYQYTRIQLTAADVSWEINARGAEVAPDGQGNFMFTGVTPGSYIISTALSERDTFLSASRLVRVQDADLEDVRLFPSESVLRGRVRVDGSTKIEFDKLHVHFANPYSWPLDGKVASDGGFTFHAISHYTYRVGLSGAEDLYIKSVQIGGQDALDGIVDLSDGQAPAGMLEVVLGADGGRIDGVATNENGVPTSSAVVVLIPEVRYRRKSSLFKSTTSDQNGRFTIRGIAPGDYKLFAWDDIEPGNWWNPEFLNHYEDQGEDLNVAANAHLSRRIHVIATGE